MGALGSLTGVRVFTAPLSIPDETGLVPATSGLMVLVNLATVVVGWHRRRPTPSVRPHALLVGVLMLPLIPLGTALGLDSLVLLSTDRSSFVLSAAYAQVRARAPAHAPAPSKLARAVLTLAGALLLYLFIRFFEGG